MERIPTYVTKKKIVQLITKLLDFFFALTNFVLKLFISLFPLNLRFLFLILVILLSKLLQV
jgi:hypothetical protein